MSYADEFTTQSCFYTSNGLSREVMSGECKLNCVKLQ